MQKVSEIKIDIPKYPEHILNTLHNAGYEAYIVGGCVRDALLGNVPSDFDITTSAKPEKIKELFRKTIDTGIKHGTVTVLFYENGKPFTYEVTTFRIDGDYEDSRHPKDVVFVNDLKEDLLRRDFTINAMAYSTETGLVDEFGGLIDLDKKIVSAVGRPNERFTEDALRLMRAIRFAAKLGFTIEEETKNAIPKLAKNLALVSKERVQVELTKTITSNNPSYVNLVFELGLAPYITKSFDNIKVGKFIPYLDTHLAYACLLYNTDVNVAYEILRELKLDNNNINKVISLLSSKQYIYIIESFYKEKKINEFEISIKELINRIKYDLIYDLIKLVVINEKKEVFLKKMIEFVDKCKKSKEPIYISDIAINGNDLLSIGYIGQEIGIALSSLLKIVHKDAMFNKKEMLINISKEAYKLYKKEGGSYELS